MTKCNTFLVSVCIMLLIPIVFSCSGGTTVDRDDENNDACSSNSDCSSGEICDDETKRCVDESSGCLSDSDCSANQKCDIPFGADRGNCVANQIVNGCVYHHECTIGYSCSTSMRTCIADANAIACNSSSGCISGYSCLISGVSGKCVPDASAVDGDDESTCACQQDSDCGDVTQQFCYQCSCQPRYPTCAASGDCWPGQTCNTESGKCEGEVIIDGDTDTDTADGDLPIDGDDDNVTPPDGDEEMPPADPDPDPDPIQPDGDDDQNICIPCASSNDCPGILVCGTGSCCIEPCDAESCPSPTTCNASNGFCEFCNPACTGGRCCNYNEDYWYCGTCCTPPCGAGKVCQAGSCVTPYCPICSADEHCDGFATGWMCVPDEVDGDSRFAPTSMRCLPANSDCTEGVDHCCSGVCLMGTCL